MTVNATAKLILQRNFKTYAKTGKLINVLGDYAEK